MRPEGLSSREAERRLLHYGPNRLERRHGRRWPKQLARQFTHPLALLLWGAAALAAIAGITPIAIAVVVVIVLNALEMGAFFYVLLRAGWSPNDPTGEGSPLHHAYQQATTMTFLSMVACQVGTAFAARTERASLRSIGVFSNRLLLWGIVFELALAAVLIYVPVFQDLLGTAALPWHDLLLVVPFPFIVWGADELRRWRARQRGPRPASRPRPELSVQRP